MRAFFFVPLLLAGQACVGTVCEGVEQEFVLNDEVTPAGIRVSEARERLPESYVTQARNQDGTTGDVQVEIHPRTGDAVYTTVVARGPNTDQWCGTGRLSLPVTIELTTLFGGEVTLAADRFFFGRESEWNVDLVSHTLLHAAGFGEQRDSDGELLEGYEFLAGFARDSHSEFGTVSLTDPKGLRRDVLEFERQVTPDEEDW